MQREAERLFPDSPTEAGQFLESLLDPPAFASGILWTGSGEDRAAFLERFREASPRLEWMPEFAISLQPGQEPGRDPLYETGAFYPLDISSIWAASTLLSIEKRTTLRPSRVLDVCAAPGGKSLFALQALNPDVLVSNEVIGKRLAILRHNLSRCGAHQAWTQRMDPRDLAEKAPGAFDVVIVDAPCSGQSLLAKGIENPGAFHPATIKGNAKRQLGILSTAFRCLAPGGWMLYSTCTFSERENERVIERLQNRHPALSCQEVSHLAPWQSALAPFPAYRLYPHSGIGAGAFACLLRRQPEESFGTGESPPPGLPPPLLEHPVLPRKPDQ